MDNLMKRILPLPEVSVTQINPTSLEIAQAITGFVILERKAYDLRDWFIDRVMESPSNPTTVADMIFDWRGSFYG